MGSQCIFCYKKRGNRFANKHLDVDTCICPLHESQSCSGERTCITQSSGATQDG